MKRKRGYAAHLNRADVDWPALRQKVHEYATAVELAQRAIEKVIYPQWGRLLIAPASEIATWRGEPPRPAFLAPLGWTDDPLAGLVTSGDDALAELLSSGAMDAALDALCSPETQARTDAALDEILSNPIDLSLLFNLKEQ